MGTSYDISIKNVNNNTPTHPISVLLGHIDKYQYLPTTIDKQKREMALTRVPDHLQSCKSLFYLDFIAAGGGPRSDGAQAELCPAHPCGRAPCDGEPHTDRAGLAFKTVSATGCGIRGLYFDTWRRGGPR